MQRRERGQGQHCETGGRICDDPLPGLGRAWQAWSSSGPSRGVPQSECLGNPWRLRGGCAAALPPRGSRLPWQQQGFPGLRASILANMCRRKVRPEEEGSQTEPLQTGRRNNPVAVSWEWSGRHPCRAVWGGWTPSGACWEDTGVPPHHGSPLRASSYLVLDLGISCPTNPGRNPSLLVVRINPGVAEGLC